MRIHSYNKNFDKSIVKRELFNSRNNLSNNYWIYYNDLIII